MDTPSHDVLRVLEDAGPKESYGKGNKDVRGKIPAGVIAACMSGADRVAKTACEPTPADWFCTVTWEGGSVLWKAVKSLDPNEPSRLRKTILAQQNFDGSHIWDKPGLSGLSG
jgi:hypothetical protein